MLSRSSALRQKHGSDGPASPKQIPPQVEAGVFHFAATDGWAGDAEVSPDLKRKGMKKRRFRGRDRGSCPFRVPEPEDEPSVRGVRKRRFVPGKRKIRAPAEEDRFEALLFEGPSAGIRLWAVWKGFRPMNRLFTHAKTSRPRQHGPRRRRNTPPFP